MENIRIILNRIKTPDGTILTSHHRHDYVTHIDKNGFEYMVDGGNDYLRRNINSTKLSLLKRLFIVFLSLFGYIWIDPAKHIELSVYSNAPFEVIRENFCRGGRGKDGRQPLTWVALKDMNDEWLEACIVYNLERDMGDSYASMMYVAEQDYRKINKIKIEENDKV